MNSDYIATFGHRRYASIRERLVLVMTKKSV